MSFPMPAPVPMMPPPPGNFGMPAPQPTPYDPTMRMAPPEVILPVISTEPPDPWPGYKPPPKPKVSDVLEAAERERNLHKGRIDQGAEMQRRYDQDEALTGVFLRDRDAAATGEVEKFQDPAIRNEIDGFCSFIAQMDWTAEALYRLSIDREEAAAKEDGCFYIDENEQRQFADEGGAPSVKWRKAFDLGVSGVVAEFINYDVDNAECGLTLRMVDPNTVLPIWEGKRGLSQVYLKYQCPASRFIGTFGNHPKFKEAAVRKSAGGKSYDPNFSGEVVELWDTWRCMIIWEGDEVLSWEHKRKEVPFVITPGNFGGPIGVNTPAVSNGAGSWARTNAEQDYKRVYQPFLQREVPLHMFKEAVMGKAATYFRKASNNPKNAFLDVLDFQEGITYDNREGAVNTFQADSRIEDATNMPDPQISQAVFGAIMQAESTSRPSSLMAGNAPMSQGSGTALNILGEAGLDKWSPMVLALQGHETRKHEMCLRIWCYFGDVLGMDGNRGMIPVPRSRPNPRTGEAAAHEVTPDLLKSTGTRVNVTFSRFNPDQLPMRAQGVIMAKSGGLMPDREGIKILGYTRDIDAALEEITRQKLAETPAVTIMHTVRMLIDEVKQAEARGDADSVQDKLADLMFVIGRLEIEQTSQELQLMQMRMEKTRMQTISGMAGSGGMGMPMPSVQGMGGGMAGMNPGTMGGNLPGPNGPQMNPAGGGMPPLPPPGPMGGGF